jgi:hypothetical protein
LLAILKAEEIGVSFEQLQHRWDKWLKRKLAER